MTQLDIIRAWKDEDYRNSLSMTDQALLPSNPVGMIELSDDELRGSIAADASIWDYSCPTREPDLTCTMTIMSIANIYCVE